MAWNVIITTFMGGEAQTAKRLQKYGRFRRTRFKGILLGEVTAVEEFLDSVRALERLPFTRALPLAETFEFEPATLLDMLKEKIKPFADKIASGERYDVSVERRGLKGVISGHELESALRASLAELLKAQGKDCQLDWKDPDKVVMVQTVEKLCGLGLITRAMTARWPFVRPE